jgi:WD40 repeat protein
LDINLVQTKEISYKARQLLFTPESSHTDNIMKLIATNDVLNEIAIFSVPDLEIIQTISYGKNPGVNIFSPNMFDLSLDKKYLIANINWNVIKLWKIDEVGDSKKFNPKKCCVISEETRSSKI